MPQIKRAPSGQSNARAFKKPVANPRFDEIEFSAAQSAGTTRRYDPDCREVPELQTVNAF
jgi:hypothetical protein